MHCHRLVELPSPPQDKAGWPWTEETPQATGTLPNGRPWPKVSIITASYNQGTFIEKAIRSVLLQGYPDMEYIIIDGGSNDNSVEVIKKYEKYLAHWVSESDRGQSDALNKGIRIAKGEIISYLNSDDYYFPGAVQAVVREFVMHPEISMVHGDGRLVDPNGSVLKEIKTGEANIKSMLVRIQVFSPAFVRKVVFKEIGGFDENLHLSMDYDMWIRVVLRFKTRHVPVQLTALTLHPQTKAIFKSHDMTVEAVKVKLNYLNKTEVEKLLGNDYKTIKQFAAWELGWFSYQALDLRQARRALLETIRIKPLSLYSIKSLLIWWLSWFGKTVAGTVVWGFQSFLNPVARSLKKFGRRLRNKENE